MVEADGAELVDDDQCPAHRWITHQLVKHRGLAAAEEAGEHRDRYKRLVPGKEETHSGIVQSKGVRSRWADEGIEGILPSQSWVAKI